LAQNLSTAAKKCARKMRQKNAPVFEATSLRISHQKLGTKARPFLVSNIFLLLLETA
jgi:hypothetical protein